MREILENLIEAEATDVWLDLEEEALVKSRKLVFRMPAVLHDSPSTVDALVALYDGSDDDQRRVITKVLTDLHYV